MNSHAVCRTDMLCAWKVFLNAKIVCREIADSDYLDEHNEGGIPELYLPNIKSSVNMENVNTDVHIMFMYVIGCFFAIDCVVYDCELVFLLGIVHW